MCDMHCINSCLFCSANDTSLYRDTGRQCAAAKPDLGKGSTFADATVLGGKASSTAASMLPALGSEKRLLAGEATCISGAAVATSSGGAQSAWAPEGLAWLAVNATVGGRLRNPRAAVQEFVTASEKTLSFLQEVSTFSTWA